MRPISMPTCKPFRNDMWPPLLSRYDLMPKKTSDKEMIIVAYPETYAQGPCSRSIAPLFIAASMIHIRAAAIAPEIKPNIKTILAIVFSSNNVEESTERSTQTHQPKG